jgi:hypothetical protein
MTTQAPLATSKPSVVPASSDQTAADSISTPVTVENFSRAESDLYFGNLLRSIGGAFGEFLHYRQPTSIDHQDVIRMNRDTLYSGAIVDLQTGPVTITLPDAGKRFMSLQVVNEDQYTVMVEYGKGNYTLTKEKVGTRYALAIIRTLLDPSDPKDLDEVHRLQDAVSTDQKSGGSFDVPKWDKESQNKVRSALLVLASTLPDLRHAFGSKDEVDPVRFVIGSAAGWGGNPDKDATYLNFTPKGNDGTGVYKLTVKDVPVDAFWSISLYNAKGYFEPNQYDAYSVNNITAKKNPDGSVTVQFGGCDGKTANSLPIMPGWNYLVRLYRPRPEILNGSYQFPEPQRVA